MLREDPNKVSEVYNHWHDRREAADDLFSDLQNPWNRFVCENLPDLAGQVVLEIACGRGQLTSYIAAKGACVIGADISTRALAITRKRVSASGLAAMFVNADACRIPLADNRVDLLISCETIEHTPKPADALAEYHRVLKSKGKLVLTFPSHFNLTGLYRIYLWCKGQPYNSGDEVQPIEQPLMSSSVVAALKKLGFRIVSREGSGHYVLMPGRRPRRIEALDRSRVWHRMLGPFGLHFGLVAERQ